MIDPRSFLIAMPEIEVAFAGLFLLVVAAVCGKRETQRIGILAIATFMLAIVTMFSGKRLGLMFDGLLPAYAFGNQFVDDGFARFAKAIVLGASGLSILLSWDYFKKEGQERPEYPVLILFATLGMMLMISAGNLLALYVGIELQSLSLYVLAAFNRDQERSSEAGLKYFILGALSSGIMLYGISLIYGFAGTTDFESLMSSLRGAAPAPRGVVVGMVFVCAGLAFKLAGVPFHMWAPDVFEGAPTPVTAFFASAPKIAALALFTRFLLYPMYSLMNDWRQVIVFISVASMAWGAFAGLMQSNLKRLLAYSAIANAGTLLIGLIIGNSAGIQALLIYFVIYALGTLGAFGVILCLRRNGKPVEELIDLSGLSKKYPLVALAMAVLVFSLAGLPPLAGFFGKYFIFLAAVQAELVPLAIIGVLTSVVAAFYYIRIVKVMYFDEPLHTLDPLPDWGVRTVVGLTSVAVVILAFAPSPLVDSALNAAKGFII
ncbi:MAG: NADH-quinone oxidoreductase subunit NuoN [Bdellovibrionales bacterium]